VDIHLEGKFLTPFFGPDFYKIELEIAKFKDYQIVTSNSNYCSLYQLNNYGFKIAPINTNNESWRSI